MSDGVTKQNAAADALVMTMFAKRDAKIRELETDNARLRAALTELAVLGEQGMKPDYREWLTFHDKVVQVARCALEQTREK